MLSNIRCGAILILVFAVVGRAQPAYEGYYLFVGSDPSDRETDWTEETQGITHDETHWYLTQKDRIWRAPVTTNLNELAFGTPGVQHRELGSIPQLTSEGFQHFGDMSYYRGFLLIGIEDVGEPRDAAGIAVFRADATLAYVGHVNFDLGFLDSAPWCGVDEGGRVYTSRYNDVDRIYRFAVDWNLLDQTPPTFQLTPDGTMLLYNESGGPLSLDGVQGGVFTSDGVLL